MIVITKILLHNFCIHVKKLEGFNGGLAILGGDCATMKLHVCLTQGQASSEQEIEAKLKVPFTGNAL